uniref:Uncharacterized protein n=1 Tax=Arundo donax TaxID=35708 RepID=A0A0A9FIX4_ARUDO
MDVRHRARGAAGRPARGGRGALRHALLPCRARSQRRHAPHRPLLLRGLLFLPASPPLRALAPLAGAQALPFPPPPLHLPRALLPRVPPPPPRPPAVRHDARPVRRHLQHHDLRAHAQRPRGRRVRGIRRNARPR